MVSIVIPVYNAEKFLVDCIESILCQTYQDWELILVNDGSKDESGAICDHYTELDSRIKVIHKENNGVTAARRDGVTSARGEWIFFVDADDKVEIDGLRGLVEYSESHPDCDIIEGSYLWFFPDGNIKQRPCIAYKTGLVIQDGLTYAVNLYKEYFGSRGPWSKIIKKSVLLSSEALNIPAWLTNREDALMLTMIARKINKAVLLGIPVYKYRSQFCETAVSNKLTVDYWSNYLQYLDEQVLKNECKDWDKVWIATAIDIFQIIVHGFSKVNDLPPFLMQRVIPTLERNKDRLPLYDRLIVTSCTLPKLFGKPLSKTLLAIVKYKNKLFKNYYAKKSRKDENINYESAEWLQRIDNKVITPPHQLPGLRAVRGTNTVQINKFQGRNYNDVSKNEKGLVSIVVPVYNAERYLEECLNSIRIQQYKNWELILVDDGSKDESGAICDRYAELDSRIKVIHKENGGVTSARRDGVKVANGEWIFFVDADDKVESAGLYGLINFSEKHPDLDIVEGSYKWFYPDGTTKSRPCIAVYDGPIIMNGEDYAKSICSGKHGATGPCMKIIRKCVLIESHALEIIPRRFTNREDTLMNVVVAQHIRRYALIDVPVYLYRSQFGDSAISKTLSWEYWTDYLKFFKDAIGNWNNVFAVHAIDVFKMMVHGRNTFKNFPSFFLDRVVSVLWEYRNLLPKSDYMILAGFKVPMKLGLPSSYSILIFLRAKNNLFRGYYAKRSRKQENND